MTKNKIDEFKEGVRKIPTDKQEARGIGLKLSDWAAISAIGEKLGVTGHAVGKYLLLHALKEYQDGKIKIQTKKQTHLDFPE